MPRETDPQSTEIPLPANGVLRLDVLAPHLVRVRLSHDGKFPTPSLIRYGFISDDWARPKTEVSESKSRIVLKTELLTVTAHKSSGQLSFADANGDALLDTSVAGWSDPGRGFGARFAAQEGERFLGLGDQTRDRIEHRGTKATMGVRNVTSYVPVAFLMSTRGYGLVVNTTFEHTFDLGATSPDWFGFEGKRGRLDYYFMCGPGLPAILDRYTDLTGKAPLPPLFSFGLWFLCRTQANDREAVDDCYNFRREELPCDLVQLEPGWMDTIYDFSVDRYWSKERFPMADYMAKGPHTFMAAMQRMGFKLGLWECNDYDLSFEEERQLKGTAEHDDFEPDVVGYEVDEHLQGQVWQDRLTKPGESWFEHHKQFIDQGVVYFKQDGSKQVLEHPDRLYGNGMTDAEMHNLYPIIYSKQMHLGYREYTGRRALCFTAGGFTGIQRYTGTWTGDTGGGPEPLVAMLNLGLSGHTFVTCDMEVTTKEGIHSGFLQAWAQVNSWNYFRHPWLLGDELKPIFKFYDELRYRLIAYIYSYAHVSRLTGMPIMRALPLMYPDDDRAYSVLHEFMLGDELLVTTFERDIYLPEGDWTDYWTGVHYHGPCEMAYDPPDNRGGGLFVRPGAILPLWPLMQYVGQKPVDEITLDIYPGSDATFTLYEDDGATYDYEGGAVATTQFALTQAAAGLRVTASERQGQYKSMPARPSFLLKIHSPLTASQITQDTSVLDQAASDEVRAGTVGWAYDAETQILWVRPAKATSETSIAIDF